MKALALAAALAASPIGVHSQETPRPSEEELFGRPDPASPPSPVPATSPPQGDRSATEADLFGAPTAAETPEGTVPRKVEDPLRLGGQLYLRAQATGYEDRKVADWPLASPNLLDVYLDARPNDRVRGFTLGRMSWDPTGGSASSGLLSAVGAGTATGTAPRGVLDQLWVNFDVGRVAFVTVGKQHVKWGVGKFWNPTDYLHPVRRDPLAVFDQRSGVTLLKVHLPWEKHGWNLYGVALLEDAAGRSTPVNTLGRVGAGARAELVLGPAELGLDALVQDGSRPRFGVDLSAGVWDLDLYGELAIRTETDVTRWREVAPDAALNERYARIPADGFHPQLVLGGSWSWKYSDEDTLSLGAEYFWNGFGYDRPEIYPFLLVGAPAWNGRVPQPLEEIVPSDYLDFREPRAFTPFYVGRHYLGLFASLPAPGSWNDTTFTLSLLGNLTDRSFVARLDHSVLALTYLRVETFVSVSGGARGGEFRLGLDLPPQLVVDNPAPLPDVYFPVQGETLRVPAPTVSAGVALRVSL
jgi:hypothetical protein